MGLKNRLVKNAKKPQGFFGKVMAKRMNGFTHAKLADWGMSFLPEINPVNICDFGCGGGRNVGELLKKYPESNVFGLDYSDVSVETSREHNKEAISAGRCTIKEGNVASNGFEDDSLSLATAFETIYFWQGLSDCFTEVCRSLEEGGIFLIVNEADGIDKKSDEWEKIIGEMKVYNIGQIFDALEKAGFSKMEAHHHEAEPWIAVLAEK